MNAAVHHAAGPTAAATLHLHPLRRCNLACRHCYSHSSPSSTDILSRDEALAAITQAADWGYTRLAVSGGEPLLYPWLADCIDLAHDLGMDSAVVTNGLLLAQAEKRRLLRRARVVAVSIDGLDETHDAIRGRARAFSGVVAGLTRLVQEGVDAAVICGVCKDNLEQIEEVAALALHAGARSLQFHPIAETGRAREQMAGAALSDEDSVLLYVAASILEQHYEGQLAIHTDLLHQRQVLAAPGLAYAREREADSAARRPADLLGVLVLEPDGTLNPVSYGFGPAYSLGNVRAAPYRQLWQAWVERRYGRLLALGRALLGQIRDGGAPTVFNPSDRLCAASLAAGA